MRITRKCGVFRRNLRIKGGGMGDIKGEGRGESQ